ncbi:transposase [Burkholderia mayonis]|uniref:Transposase n=1 Tax=Burkholderia mayonis TaxID=1385591 RepID=A0A1B4G3A9_9BURK|nr:transposase [Burkholderia mayonis]AOJ10419.1 transposase [Burkholderia mayonis]KVE53600.1 transposase [Burkholderia mayonis]
MTPYRDINDEEWQRVAPLLPELRPRKELRGRPLADTRAVLNGVLWVIHSGANWSAMPRRFPAYQTCHRRFKAWHESGALKRVLVELFGAESDDLCELMAMRMRTHARSKAAEARSGGASATSTAPRHDHALEHVI